MHVWAQPLPGRVKSQLAYERDSFQRQYQVCRAKEQEEVQKRSPWFLPTRRLERQPTITYRADIKQKILLEAVTCSTKT